MISIKSTRFFLALALALSLTLCLSAALLAQDGFSIGVVNLDKAMGDSKMGKAALAKMQTKADTLKKSLEAKQQALQKRESDLGKKASSLSQEALEKQVNQLRADAASFQEEYQKSMQDMDKSSNDTMRPVIDKARQAVSAISESRKFDMVLDVNAGVLYYDQASDITAEVTKALDSGK
jgi:Skp family chaperone for outer membrane proteins